MQAALAPWHSIPLALGVLAVAVFRGARAWRAFAWSWLLHIAVDFCVHGRDAHPHFFPLSDFRFESPISYWDRTHHGAIVAAVEVAAVAAASVALARRHPTVVARALLAATTLSLVVAYATGWIFWGT